MDIAALSMSLAQTNLMEDVSLNMLKNSLNINESVGDMLSQSSTSALELSVQPSIGSNIDVSV